MQHVSTALAVWALHGGFSLFLFSVIYFLLKTCYLLLVFIVINNIFSLQISSYIWTFPVLW